MKFRGQCHICVLKVKYFIFQLLCLFQFIFFTSACLGTIAYLIPILFPLFSPSKREIANWTSLCGKRFSHNVVCCSINLFADLYIFSFLSGFILSNDLTTNDNLGFELKNCLWSSINFQ